jgi:hypothetical protein
LIGLLGPPTNCCGSAVSLQAGFFSKDATSFTVVQMMVATLVLTAFVTLLVFWQSLFEYYRSLWKTR